MLGLLKRLRFLDDSPTVATNAILSECKDIPEDTFTIDEMVSTRRIDKIGTAVVVSNILIWSGIAFNLVRTGRVAAFKKLIKVPETTVGELGFALSGGILMTGCAQVSKITVLNYYTSGFLTDVLSNNNKTGTLYKITATNVLKTCLNPEQYFPAGTLSSVAMANADKKQS